MAKKMDAVCAQNRMLQHEKEQVDQKHMQEKQDLQARYYDELKRLVMWQSCDGHVIPSLSLSLCSLRNRLDESEQDRDNLRFKLSEYKRGNDRLNEMLACIGPNSDSSKREIEKIIEERDQLRAQVNGPRRESQTLQVGPWQV